MNITVVCDVLGRENNGTTTAALNLINHLKNCGHNVKVICPDQDKKDTENYVVVPIINLGKWANNYLAKNGVSLAKADAEILKNAIKGSDVIHLLVPFGLSKQAIKIAKELNIPITASFHCQAENITSHLKMMNFTALNNAIYKGFNKKVFQYVDAIHYPTQFIRDVFENVVGKTNGYVISNGVKDMYVRKQVEKPAELQDKFVIVFTGRFSKEKSHTVLIDAVEKSKYCDKIQLIFAGDGPLKEKLIEYSNKLTNKPIFKYFSRKDLVDTLNYADLYVHPAEIEIEAIACLEAIACGLVPIIANSPRCATKAFALGDKNLFENLNSEDLTQKIDYWIEHPQQKQQCSNEYLGYVKQFSFDSCMNKMEQMLIETVQKHKNK